jgi:hypothetical protein
MTASLHERTSALRTKLTQLDGMASNVSETTSLEGLRTQLARPAGQLQAQLEMRTLLASAGIEAASPASLTSAQKKAQAMLTRFQAETKAAVLKKGQAWQALLDDMSSAAKDLGGALQSAWKGYRQTAFAGEPPTSIRAKLARTPANDAAFKRYEALFAKLKEAFDAMPADQQAIARVSEVARQLAAAAQDFDFDVPAEVKRFLEGVLSVGGAPLSLLTPSVAEWLRANGTFDQYSIRSAGRG